MMLSPKEKIEQDKCAGCKEEIEIGTTYEKRLFHPACWNFYCSWYCKQKIDDKEKLLDQLYRFEGIMGLYNCQNGGANCKFQTNFHRLIRKEIELLKVKVK